MSPRHARPRPLDPREHALALVCAALISVEEGNTATLVRAMVPAVANPRTAIHVLRALAHLSVRLFALVAEQANVLAKLTSPDSPERQITVNDLLAHTGQTLAEEIYRPDGSR